MAFWDLNTLQLEVFRPGIMSKALPYGYFWK